MASTCSGRMAATWVNGAFNVVVFNITVGRGAKAAAVPTHNKRTAAADLMVYGRSILCNGTMVCMI